MLLPTLHSYVNPSHFCANNISWKDVGVVVYYKKRKRNIIEMSEMHRKRPLSKNEDTKVVGHFEENNYDENDLYPIATKSNSLFNAYESLKSPPLFTVHFLQAT